MKEKAGTRYDNAPNSPSKVIAGSPVRIPRSPLSPKSPSQSNMECAVQIAAAKLGDRSEQVKRKRSKRFGDATIGNASSHGRNRPRSSYISSGHQEGRTLPSSPSSPSLPNAPTVVSIPSPLPRDLPPSPLPRDLPSPVQQLPPPPEQQDHAEASLLPLPTVPPTFTQPLQSAYPPNLPPRSPPAQSIANRRRGKAPPSGLTIVQSANAATIKAAIPPPLKHNAPSAIPTTHNVNVARPPIPLQEVRKQMQTSASKIPTIFHANTAEVTPANSSSASAQTLPTASAAINTQNEKHPSLKNASLSSTSKKLQATLRRKRRPSSFYKPSGESATSSNILSGISGTDGSSTMVARNILAALLPSLSDNKKSSKALESVLKLPSSMEPAEFMGHISRLYSSSTNGVRNVRILEALLTFPPHSLFDHLLNEITNNAEDLTRRREAADCLSSLAIHCYGGRTNDRVVALEVLRGKATTIVQILKEPDWLLRSNVVAMLGCLSLDPAAYIESQSNPSSFDDAVKELVELLEHKSPEIRESAIAGLMGLGPIASQALDPLIQIMLNDKVTSVRCLAARAFKDIGMPHSFSAMGPLQEVATKDREESVRKAAQKTLLELGTHPNVNQMQPIEQTRRPATSSAYNSAINEEIVKEALLKLRSSGNIHEIEKYISSNYPEIAQQSGNRLRTHIRITMKRMANSGLIVKNPAIYSLQSAK